MTLFYINLLSLTLGPLKFKFTECVKLKNAPKVTSLPSILWYQFCDMIVIKKSLRSHWKSHRLRRIAVWFLNHEDESPCVWGNDACTLGRSTLFSAVSTFNSSIRSTNMRFRELKLCSTHPIKGVEHIFDSWEQIFDEIFDEINLAAALKNWTSFINGPFS